MSEKRFVALLIIAFAILFTSSCAFFNPINEDTNAALVYIRAGSMFTELPKSLKNKVNDIIDNGWTGNNEELKEILSKNQDAIKEFKKATKLTYCDFRLGKPVEKTQTAPEHKFKEFYLAKLVIIEGRLYEKQNKLNSALDDYLSVLRYSHHVGTQNTIVCISFATRIQKLLYIPLAQYIDREKLSIKDYRFLLNNLLSFRNRRSDFEIVFEEQKEYMNELLRGFGEDIKKTGEYDESFFQKLYKEYDRLNDEYYGYLATAFEENRPEMYEEKIKQFRNKLEKEIEPFNLDLKFDFITEFIGIKPGGFPPEMPSSLVGKIFFLYGIPKVCFHITRYHVSLGKFNILKTAVAVRLYELENGKLPDSLQDLIPNYFSKLPEDPFNDFKPMKYEKRAKGWVVYSFGPDRQDNHGTIKYNEKSKDKTGDIVFS